MFSLFPELLDYSLLATTLLRITAGFIFLLVGLHLLTTLHKIAMSTRMAHIAGVTYGLVEVLVGALLTLGVYTQGAALAGMVLALLGFKSRGATRATLGEQHARLLLFIVCLALLFQGPGIFAVDLPL